MFNQCILYNAKQLERSLTSIVEQEFMTIDMHPTYAYILTVIASSDYVKTKQISNELTLDSSTVTRMVSKLEAEGYVVKGSDNSPCDIGLSAQGKQLMPAIEAAWERYHKRCDQLLTVAGKNELNELLMNTNKKLNQ